MKRGRLTWFAFDASDWLYHDARTLTLAEAGALINLLAHAFVEHDCGLPSDDKRLARLLGISPGEWKKIRANVLAKFEFRDGRYYNDDLIEEKKRAQKASDDARARVKKRGGRWADTEEHTQEHSPVADGCGSGCPAPGASEREADSTTTTTRYDTRDVSTQEHSTVSEPGSSSNSSPPRAHAFNQEEPTPHAANREMAPPPASVAKCQPGSLPAWVRETWRAHGISGSYALHTHRLDSQKLYELVQQRTELIVRLAWAKYVFDDPPRYNLDPVEVAARVTTKAGKEWLQTTEDASRITRYPFAAFLADCEGYLVEAERELASGATELVLFYRRRFGDKMVDSVLLPILDGVRK